MCFRARYAHQMLFVTMIQDVRDARAKRDDLQLIKQFRQRLLFWRKPPVPVEQRPATLLVLEQPQVRGALDTRRYNDISMYRFTPSCLRPGIIGTVITQLVFEMFARRDGDKDMMMVLSTQHCLRLLHEDAMKVRASSPAVTICGL